MICFGWKAKYMPGDKSENGARLVTRVSFEFWRLLEQVIVVFSVRGQAVHATTRQGELLTTGSILLGRHQQ